MTDLQTIVQWGWIPMIIWVGYRNSSPQPSLIKWVSLTTSLSQS